jgi:hypothetical protein|tara:strand:+ start:312 stop:1301 length:990 start_codon:yes stop_codon:yes gene_type:complete
MFRWGLIALGLVFVWGGIDNHLNYSDTINETALNVGLGELKKIIQADETKYVSYQGAIAPGGRIYRSYLEIPRYSAYAPRDVQSVSAESLRATATVNRYLGSQVEIDSPLASSYIELQLIREEGSDRSLQGMSIIAPLAGSSSRLWVLSPWFSSGDAADKDAWLQKQSYSGRLAKLGDLNSNVQALKKNVAEIKSLFSRQHGQVVPSDALVILGHRPMMLAGDVRKAKYHALVAETDAMLYVETTDEQLSKIRQSGKLTGVLKPTDSRFYSGFRRVLDGMDLPARIGILSEESGKQVNEDNLRVTLIGVLGGLAMLALGGFLIRRGSQK